MKAPLLTNRTTTPTLADLLKQLGGISADRVLLHPPPGQATERDVLEIERREDRLCELVDGTLVEKAGGFPESVLGAALISLLKSFIAPRNLGLLIGGNGPIRLAPGLVRLPDIAFISWDRIPGRKIPRRAIPKLVPDLVVEVLSRKDTKGEMARKRREYFAVGTRLMWLVSRKARTVAVFTGPKQSGLLDEADTLNGGAVLPGFVVPLRDLFAVLDATG